MVIDDLDVLSACVSPTKTNAKLIIDPDTMLPGAISSERFQMITWRNPQVIQASRNFHCRNLRRATAAILENRLTGIPQARA
jgi:hypothetical protein